jgi:hypothetical protein
MAPFEALYATTMGVSVLLEIEKRIHTLAGLAVKCSRRCHHDNNAVFTVITDRRVLGHVREALANEVNGASYIDIHDKIEVVKAERVQVAVENLHVESISESI